MSLKNAGKNVFEKEDGALEAFRRYLELDEKSEATIRKYMHDVKVFLTFQKGKGSFRKEQIIGYKNWLGERYAVRSANSMLTAVNQFLKFVGAGECCVKLFKLQYQTFCDQRKELGREEYRRLLETARRKKQIRLYFLILTLCATGIRISELQYITVEAAVSGNTIAKNKGKSRVILIPAKALRCPSGLCGMDRDLSRPDFYYPRWKARGPEQCVESDAEAVQGSRSARGKSISP